MSNTVENLVIQFLDKNQDTLIKDWLSKTMIKSDEVYDRDTIQAYGLSMINLVIAFLRDDALEEKLQGLAEKVARQRLEAKVNIGDFVYNVSVGRSVIFNYLPDIGLSIDQLHPTINKINLCFDRFLYFAIHHYTELKDNLLAEQTSFIENNHKDRLTILGQMSSSFVHEFRNPLTSVMGFVHLLTEKYPKLEYLDIITKELNELKFRITQFLIVSKKDLIQKEKEQVIMSDLIGETLDFLFPVIMSCDVTIETTIHPSQHFTGYRDELRQVLLNIIMNSLDVLVDPSENPKLIRIEGYSDNGYEIIDISNNGPLIPKEAIRSIFEPFFTTKKLGTGIGLYICRKIIEEHHNGSISCESHSGWTTFRIAVPST